MTFNFKMMPGNDQKFYAKMGHFFASRKIRKEIGGYPLNNEDDWIWMVATEKHRLNVAGFICIEPTKNGLLMHDCFVESEYRGNGVFATLLEKVIYYAEFEKKDLYASVNEKMQQVFEKRGFDIVGKRGQWLTMGRPRDEKEVSE